MSTVDDGSQVKCFECGHWIKNNEWLKNPTDNYGCSRHEQEEVKMNNEIEFSNDLVQAEFSNITNDTSNPWEWKKGEEMNRWTDGTDWIIVKVNEYPDCGITLRKVGA